VIYIHTHYVYTYAHILNGVGCVCHEMIYHLYTLYIYTRIVFNVYDGYPFACVAA